MSDYTLQDCNITVPDAFRDRTMNLFTLSHTGANEFTFVISRATASADDTLKSVSSRLAKELDTTLEELSLFHAELITLAGKQALVPIDSEDKPGRYALWETAGERKATIISSLLLSRSVRGIPGMENTEAVEAYISQRINHG